MSPDDDDVSFVVFDGVVAEVAAAAVTRDRFFLLPTDCSSWC
jgi:hypothetical protein